VSRFNIFERDNYLLEGEIAGKRIFLHLSYIGKFTKTNYLEMLEDWDEICEYFKSKGVSKLYSVVPFSDKVCKWQNMFGLSHIANLGKNRIYRRVL